MFLHCVYSALEDVYSLCTSLNASLPIQSSLVQYEQHRLQEVKSLCRLMSFSFPYQYNQDPIKSKLYLANFAVRFMLNKLFPTFFSLPSFFLVQDEAIGYEEVLRRSHQTTRNLFLMMTSLIIICSAHIMKFNWKLVQSFLIKKLLL